MIESALVFLPTFALLAAIMDLAMPIFLRATMTHAAREGVRYGITYQTTTGQSQTNSIKQVVQSYAMGFLAGSSGLSKISVRYYLPVSPFTEVTGTSNANASGNILEVSINGYQYQPMLPLCWNQASGSVCWGQNYFVINAISTNRLESLPSSATKPTP